MTLAISTGFAKPWRASSARGHAVLAQDAARRIRARERVVAVRDALRPTVELAFSYRRRLLAQIDEMGESVLRDLGCAYGEQDDKIATISGDGLAYDAAAAADLQSAVRRLSRTWQGRFNGMAQELADYFATSAARRSDAQLRRILRRGGITVRFKLTPALKEVLRAAINENVALIRSIPAQYFPQVEGAVMRSVAAGRDLQSLAKDLREQHGVTRRRAVLIARDQNNKATAVIGKVRLLDLGIEEATWLHSHAGREPRPTHVANHGKTYNVKQGWWDPAIRKYIWPGTEINCRCVFKPVLP